MLRMSNYLLIEDFNCHKNELEIREKNFETSIVLDPTFNKLSDVLHATLLGQAKAQIDFQKFSHALLQVIFNFKFLS